MFFIKGGYDTKLQRMKNISKTTLSKNLQVKVYQPYAIFVVEEDTLVVLVILEMDPKRHQLLSQRRLGLKNQRSLTTKDPKRFGYLNLLDFFLGIKEGEMVLGQWLLKTYDMRLVKVCLPYKEKEDT